MATKTKATGAGKHRSTKTRKDHPLTGLIPAEWFGEDYIPRTIDGVLDIDALRKARLLRHNTLIEGPTGPGKTSLVMAFGAIDRIPVILVPCNGGATPESLFGQWKPDGHGGWMFVEGPVTVAARHGGVVYLDELNMAMMKIMAVLHPALDKRRTITIMGGDADSVQKATIQLHPDCQFIASYNPDYEDTRPLNEALKNRFALKMVFDYDPDIERQFINITILVDLAEQLRYLQREGDIRTPTSPNMLSEFEQFTEMGLDFAIRNFLNAYHAEERQVVAEIINNNRVELQRQVDEYWGMEYDEAEGQE